VQNIENEQWSLGEVNRKLQVKMERAADAVIDKQHEINGSVDEFTHTQDESFGEENGLIQTLEPVDLRTAAYVLAIG
jgi:hypothetical protein